MRALSALRSLENITLGPVNDEAMNGIGTLTQLRSINLMNSDQLTDKGLAPLSNLTLPEQRTGAECIPEDHQHGLGAPGETAGRAIIHVSGQTGITDAGLQHFKEATYSAPQSVFVRLTGHRRGRSGLQAGAAQLPGQQVILAAIRDPAGYGVGIGVLARPESCAATLASHSSLGRP